LIIRWFPACRWAAAADIVAFAVADRQLDETDARIIAALSQDGRTPVAELARVAGVSESMARRRLERLIGEGFIAVTAIPNPGRIGLTVAAMLELDVEPAQLERAAAALSGLDEVVFVGSLIGERQLAASVLLPSVQAFHHFVAERLATVPGLRGVRSSLIANVYKLPLRIPIPMVTGGP
jgi:DNA-binding Lrp family transcriptional regulator